MRVSQIEGLYVERVARSWEFLKFSVELSKYVSTADIKSSSDAAKLNM
jgi:hypothetical protein